MGSALGGLFGGGYSAPETPQIKNQPLPEQAKDPASKAVRDAERRRILARRGGSANILTSPLGTGGQASNNLGILGKN